VGRYPFGMVLSQLVSADSQAGESEVGCFGPGLQLGARGALGSWHVDQARCRRTQLEAVRGKYLQEQLGIKVRMAAAWVLDRWPSRMQWKMTRGAC
jgi:hypothetical protein